MAHLPWRQFGGAAAGGGAIARAFFAAKDSARIIIAQRQALHASKQHRRRNMRTLGRDGEGGCREVFFSLFDRWSLADKSKFFHFSLYFYRYKLLMKIGLCFPSELCQSLSYSQETVHAASLHQYLRFVLWIFECYEHFTCIEMFSGAKFSAK